MKTLFDLKIVGFSVINLITAGRLETKVGFSGDSRNEHQSTMKPFDRKLRSTDVFLKSRGHGRNGHKGLTSRSRSRKDWENSELLPKVRIILE